MLREEFDREIENIYRFTVYKTLTFSNGKSKIITRISFLPKNRATTIIFKWLIVKDEWDPSIYKKHFNTNISPMKNQNYRKNTLNYCNKILAATGFPLFRQNNGKKIDFLQELEIAVYEIMTCFVRTISY